MRCTTLPVRILLLACIAAAGCGRSPDRDSAADESTNPDLAGAAAVREQARRRGVTFRAVGQEPGWMLEMFDSTRIELVTDYGEQRFTTPVPPPVAGAEPGVTVYHAVTEATDLRISIGSAPCSDSMSGEAFPNTVEIVVNGREYHGCGGPL